MPSELLYLEDFIDTVTALPLEIQRKYSLLKEREALFQEATDNLYKEIRKVLAAPRDEGTEDRLVQIRKDLQRTLGLAEEKVCIAEHVHSIAESHHGRLQEDMQNLVDELRLTQHPGIPKAPEPKADIDTGKRRTKGHLRQQQQPDESTAKKGRRGIAGRKRKAQQVEKKQRSRTNKKKSQRGRSQRTTTDDPEEEPEAEENSQEEDNSEQHEEEVEDDENENENDEELENDKEDPPIAPPPPPDSPRPERPSAPPTSPMRRPGEAEQTYCYCNQVSFGQMVACDNVNCEIEWFHDECVGLKSLPKGRWYCPDCLARMKKQQVMVAPPVENQ